jgi:S-adenosylmethionine synthetase
LVSVEQQSPQITNIVFKKEEDQLGARNQGIMFGYATDDASIYFFGSCSRSKTCGSSA